MAEKHLFLQAICCQSYKENSEQKSDSSEFNYSFEVSVSIYLNWMVLPAHIHNSGGWIHFFASLGKLCSAFLSE